MSTNKIAPYYSQSGLAAAAGLTRYAVNAAIRRGLLDTVQTIDGLPLIPKAEAERWLQDRRPAHRPGAGACAGKK